METSLENLTKRIEKLETELQTLKSRIAGVESAGGKEQKATLQPAPAAIRAPERKKGPSLIMKLNEKLGGQIELSIGGFIIGITGALAFILGAGWFIKLAIERRWLNESMRVISSILIGFGTIAGSWVLANKKFKVLPAVVLGTGLAVLYFAIFSSYYFYDLLPMREAFIFLFIISIVSTFFAAAIKSQFLYIFSLVGALLAPVLMSQGENSYRFLFSYLTVFNVIFVMMSRKFSWKTTAYLLLVCNAALYFAWQDKNLSESSFPVPALFITSVFHIYMLRYYFIIKQGGAINRAEHILIVVNILVYTVLGHITLRQFHASLVPHFYILVCFFIAGWQFLFRAIPDPAARLHTGDWTLLCISPLAITGASIFFAAPWEMTAAIAVSGTLSLLGSYRDQRHFALLAAIMWCITIIVLISSYHTAPPDSWLILNKRFYLYALSALFLIMTFYFRRANKNYLIYGFAALFLLILASLFESHDLFIDDRYTRQISYSCVFLIYAFMLLFPGFKLSKPVLRFTGLSLIGIVIAKFYVYDVWSLSLIARIIAGFGLGIVLLFTAIFYQKFRERLVKTMFSKKVQLILVAIMIATAANAEPVRVQSFKFYKELAVEAPADRDYIYGTIDMDDEIYKYSYGYDLRIVAGTEALPYFLTRRKPDENKQDKQPKIIFNTIGRESSAYVLELPAIPAGSEYNELAINTATANNYEMNVALSASADLKNWQSIGTYFIYKYSTAAFNKPAFHLSGVKYLRIETGSRIPLLFPRTSYLTKKTNDYVQKVPLEEIDSSSDPDKQAAVYYYRNEQKKIISQITMNFSDGRFYRRFEIYVKSGKQYNQLMSGSISQNKPEKQIIDLARPVRDEIKILIVNGDNNPLRLEQFEISGPREVLVFELPKKETLPPLRLYYGNRYIKTPGYDILNTYNKSARHIQLTAGRQKVNKNFSYSAIEPPVSTWIIRILFLAGFLALIWPSYRIIKKYTEDMEKTKSA